MRDFNDRRSFEQTIREQEYPHTQPIQRQSSSGMITLGLSIVAAVMFVSLFFSGINVAITVVATAAFYGVIITLVLLIDSGTFAYWLGKRSEERARIEEMRLAYGYHTQRVTVESPHRERELPAPPAPQLPVASSFVAPVAPGEDSVQREAVAWVLQLYARSGELDHDKVLTEQQTDKPEQVGRIRRKNPSRQAAQWLLEHRILKPTNNGYKLNVARYSTRDHAQDYFSRLTGVGGHHPSTTVPHHPLIGQEIAQ